MGQMRLEMYFEETEAVDDAIRILRVKTKTLPFLSLYWQPSAIHSQKDAFAPRPS